MTAACRLGSLIILIASLNYAMLADTSQMLHNPAGLQDEIQGWSVLEVLSTCLVSVTPVTHGNYLTESASVTCCTELLLPQQI